MNLADVIDLSPEQERKAVEIDNDVQAYRAGIAAWHRLLDRRRLDCKTGLHPIAVISRANRKVEDDQGSLISERPSEGANRSEREPFDLYSEAEAVGMLLRCIGYLTDAEGKKLAFDKGSGQKDKMVEWIAREIRQVGGIEYIRRHQPYIFGIQLRVGEV